MPFVQLIRKGFRFVKRQPDQRKQGKERFCPKIPKRSKKRREAGEKDRCTGKCRKEHVEPQLPATDTPRKKKKPHGEQQRERCIQRIGEAALRAPPQP